MKEKLKLTPLEKSWILYDIGNSAFILMVSTLIPIYFNSLAGAAGVNEDMYLSYWGYAGSISTVLVAIIALWWVGCSVPLLKDYTQTAYQEPTEEPVKDAFRQLWNTLKEAKQEKHIFLYLLAFFFFIDGVYTIIDMATAYGAALGLDTTGLLLALLLTQFVAFPCSILFGRLSEKYDSGLLIKVCIAAYTGITVFGIFLVAQWQFWVLATLVGMFQGGIQALSRSYLGKIIPAERSGEFYGLMDIFGKGASFMGLLMASLVSQFTAGITVDVFGVTLQNENLAVGSLIILFIIGYILFCKADQLNLARSAKE